MKLIPLQLLVLIFISIINFSSCKKEKSCETCGSNPGGTNKPPISIAGSDQVITLPTDSITLDGSASTDSDGTISNWLWKKISGPASFVISNASISRTVVKNLTAGVYQFELTVKDNGGLESKDTMQVMVDDSGANQPPVAKAGADQTITLPVNNITVDGSASTDPDNNIASYQWTKISGPASFNIVNANTIQTQITNLIEGVYWLELKVTDAGGLFSKDSVKVTVIDQVPPPVSSCNNLNRPNITAQLIPVGNLSLPRAGTNAVTLGNKIFFAGSFLTYYGGTGPSYASTRVDIYDITTNTWSSAELSQARFGIAMAAAGNKVFFAGGENGDGAFNIVYATVDIYDLTTNTWSVASLSEPRSYVAAATVGNKVIFAGGEINDPQTSARIDIYDLSNNSWSISSLSEARAGIAATTINNKIYFTGGHITNYWTYIPSDNIDIYDNSSQSWSVSSLTTITGDVTSIVVAEKIYWTKGCKMEIRNVNTGNTSVDSLFSTGEWVINDGQNGVTKDNKLLYFRHFGNDRSKFDIYDLTTHNWAIGVLPANNFEYFTVIAVNNSVYLFAGYIPGTIGFSNQVWKLEF